MLTAGRATAAVERTAEPFHRVGPEPDDLPVLQGRRAVIEGGQLFEAAGAQIRQERQGRHQRVVERN